MDADRDNILSKSERQCMREATAPKGEGIVQPAADVMVQRLCDHADAADETIASLEKDLAALDGNFLSTEIDKRDAMINEAKDEVKRHYSSAIEAEGENMALRKRIKKLEEEVK